MYNKERIIEEIKRVAKKLNASSLGQKDFELNSTIPLETVKYYLGSWEQALKQAEVEVPDTKKSAQPKEEESRSNKKTLNEDKLLLELIRIYKKTGEEPTTLLVDTEGKYGEHIYRKYWKSLNEAFAQARKRFPERSENFKRKKSTVSIEDAEVSLEKYDDVERPGYNEEERMEEQKIKFIPQTIRPKETKRKPKTVGASMDFRGLKFAPADKKGVIYLFGIVAHELGFIIESISPEFPDCEGKRCVDLENNQWEHIRIQFEYRCSDVKKQDMIETECDLIICWTHDWTECPVEVLELKPEMERFQNFQLI
ncbi:MAG: hypothetical protein KAT17_10320 [Candidatus Aminicenantes bacterium]|nr:hypothetical protein [Candidatus Aminicenantes bacterium]